MKKYNVQIFDNGGKTADRYTVFINYDIYLMSYYPDRANEVCAYFGDIRDFIMDNNKFYELGIQLNKIPKNLRYQIRKLIQADRNRLY